MRCIGWVEVLTVVVRGGVVAYLRRRRINIVGVLLYWLILFCKLMFLLSGREVLILANAIKSK